MYSKTEDDKDRLFWSVALVPDILFLFSYGILFWLLVKLTLEGHIPLSSENTLPWIKRKGLGYKVLIIGLIIYMILQALMTILYLFKQITFVNLIMEMSIIITVVCSFALIFIFSLFCKYSGQPYLNVEYRRKVRAVLKVFCIWSVLKLAKGVAGFIDDDDKNFMRSVLQGYSFGKSNRWQSILIVIIYLVGEVIPFLIVLDSFMIKMFKLDARQSGSFIEIDDENVYERHLTDNERTTNNNISISTERAIREEEKDQLNKGNVLHKTSTINTEKDDIESSKDPLDDSFEIIDSNPTDTIVDNKKTVTKQGNKLLIKKNMKYIVNDPSEFEIGTEFVPKTVHKIKKRDNTRLGQLFNSTLRGEKMICRIVKFERLSSYLKEDLYEDLQVVSSF